MMIIKFQIFENNNRIIEHTTRAQNIEDSIINLINYLDEKGIIKNGGLIK